MIYDRLCELISNQLSINRDLITMDTSFADDLGVDSLDVVELTMAIEATFDVPEFDDELISKMVTVGDLFQFLSVNCD